MRRAWLAASIIIAMLGGGRALAQTGVSDDCVVLPDGPGSIQGIGDNVAAERTLLEAAERTLLEAAERTLLEAALAAHDGVLAHAARALGLPRTTLISRLARAGLASARTATAQSR